MIQSSSDISIVESGQTDEDVVIETSLRPQKLSEYIGQNQLKSALDITLKAALGRGEQLEPMLLYGPPGLGKTTLAGVVANELGGNLKVTAGPTLQRAGDLAAILTSLEAGDCLFIDEIHRLPKPVEEILYPVMEDGVLDIVVGKGAGARSVRVNIQPVSIIGATTRPSLLSGPLRDRFGHQYRLDYYGQSDLVDIITRSAKILNCEITEDASQVLASRSRATPRIANRLLKRARDFSQVKKLDIITKEAAEEILELLQVDPLGLDRLDRQVLEVLIDRFSGGPAGVESIAASLGEDADTIAEVHEPYLLQIGFLVRTPRGRKVTEDGYKHLNRAVPENLFNYVA